MINALASVIKGFAFVLVRLFFFRFDSKNGVWLNRTNHFHYCAKCMSAELLTPMREFENGFFCPYCGIFTYKRKDELKSCRNRGSNFWGKGFSAYTFIAFQLNEALGTQDCSSITIENMKVEIKKGAIFSFLRANLNGFDDSILSSNEKENLIRRWQDMIDANIDDKLCVGKNGVSLLVAYLLELIQEEDYTMRKILKVQVSHEAK